MFGNRMLYTWGPGGVRRGLIWQSSSAGASPEDPRFWCFTPYRTNGGNSDIYDANGNVLVSLPNGYNVENTNYHGVTGFKIPINTPIQINVPQYIYVPTYDTDPNGNPFLSSFGDENSYYEDIDFYIDPQMLTAGGQNRQPELEIQGRDTQYVKRHYVTLYNNYQLTNGPSVKAYGYIANSIGEVLEPRPSGDSYAIGIWDILNRLRPSFPSCPMRIQMRVVYSDYAFAMSGAFSGGQSAADSLEFPFSLCNSYLTNILNGYNVPTDQYFNGSGIQSKLHGSFYQNFNVPTFQPISADRTETYALTSQTHKFYRYTKGALYEGLNNDFQMYVSPVMYPGVYNIDGPGMVNDYTIHLPSVASGVNTQNFGKHASPYMLPPIIKTPYLKDIIYYGSGNQTPEYYATRMGFTSGTITSNSDSNVNAATTFMTGEINSFSALRTSILGAQGVSRINTLDNPNFTYEDLIQNLEPNRQRTDQITGYLQPVVNKGTKYTQEFEVITAKGDTTSRPLGTSDGALSGRFKYIGLKGKISWYETL